MEVVNVNQVEAVAEPSVCEMPPEPVPEVPKPVDNPVAEEVKPKEQATQKRPSGRQVGFKPSVKVEKVFQEERVLEELGHLKRR